MQLAVAAEDRQATEGDAGIVIRAPRDRDGPRVWQLVADTASLDGNSVYCNLLQCSHFAGTCAIAERDGEILGWLSGYIPPSDPDTYFVWQVCTAAGARGRGLGKRLIAEVLARDVCKGVTRIQSTITDDNVPSWGLFRSIAAAQDAAMSRKPHFTRDDHFDGRHDTEFLVTIGPIRREAG